MAFLCPPELVRRNTWLELELSKHHSMQLNMAAEIRRLRDNERRLLIKLQNMKTEKTNTADHAVTSEKKLFLPEGAKLGTLEVCNAESKIDETDRVLSDKKDLVTDNSKSEEGKNVEEKSGGIQKDEGLTKAAKRRAAAKRRKALKLIKRTEVLNTEKSVALDTVLNDDLVVEDKTGLEEDNEKRLELLERVRVLEREKSGLEAECRKVMKEKDAEIQKILKEKMAVEEQKRKIEEEMKQKVSEHEQRIVVLEGEKRKMKAGLCKILKEKRIEAERFVNEKMDLEAQKRMVEDLKEKLDLEAQRIGVLEREKNAVEAELSKAKTERVTEINVVVKMALEAEKRRMEEEKGRTSKLVERIEVLQRENKEMEAEVFRCKKRRRGFRKRRMEEKERACNIVHGIGVPEREGGMEAGVFRAMKGKKIETQWIRKPVMDQVSSRGRMEESREMHYELSQRIEALEREKGVLEAKILDILKDETDIEAEMGTMGKEGSVWISKLEEAGESSQQIFVSGNVGMSSALSRNEGQSSALVAHPDNDKQVQSQNTNFAENVTDKLEGETTSSISHKRKQPSRSSDGDDPDRVAKCMKSMKEPATFDVDQDLLDAFHGDRELCLKAVCALYRRHMTKNVPPSSKENVFKPEYASKAISLAEYLIDEDPERRMKKSVADLDELDPKAVDECVEIAERHYEQVFEIHQKKEDPLFLH